MEENKNIEEESKPQNPNEDIKSSSNLFVEAEQPKTNNEKQETINEQQETETMEVHTHPHSAHGKKTWKQYFWEFLMLFLAVTLSFFVENRREHYIEHQRAKQYATLLVADLEKDRIFYNMEISRLSTSYSRFDSLISLLRQPVPAPNDTVASLLFYSNYVTDARLIAATYNQMKMSGSLRYISNPDVINSLQEYYEILLPRCITSSERSLQFFQEYILPFFINNVRQKTKPVIIGRSADSDQRLSNIIEKANTILEIAQTFYDPAEKKTGELIALLNTEYQLK